MTNKRSVVVLLVVAASVLLLAGVFYFLNQRFRFFADESSNNLVTYCQVDVDCDDGISFTSDTCESPATSEAICRHKFNRPTSMCHWYPQGSVAASTGYLNGNIDQKNLLDNIDIIGNSNLPRTEPIINTKVGNLLTDLSPTTNSDLIKKGKMMLEHIGRTELAQECGVSGAFNNDIASDQISSCADKMTGYLSTKYLEPKESDGSPVARGLEYDELNFAPDAHGLGNLLTAMAQAFRSVKQKYPYASIYIWMSSDLGLEGDKVQVYVDLLKASDYRIAEVYLNDSLPLVNNVNMIKEKIEAFKNFEDKYNFSANQRNVIMSVNGMIESDTLYTYDLSSAVDYYRLLDYQMNLYKQAINQREADGIAIFHCNRGPEEQSVLKQLINHYITQDNNDRLYESNVNNDYLENTSFESTSGWQLQGAADGILTYSVYGNNLTILNSNNGFKKFSQVAAPEIPNAVSPPDGHRLYMQKGQSPNVASQEIKNLTAGKTYKIEIYSKKITGDFGESGVVSKIVDALGKDVDAQYNKMTFFNIVPTYGTVTQYIYPYDLCQKYFNNQADASGQSIPCNKKNNLWTKEEIVFKTPSDISNLTLQITDSEAGTVIENDEEVGDVNVVDFVQLQECYVPNPEIRADAVDASSGDLITYTVEYHNISNGDKTNVNLSVPIDRKLKFISASDGGSVIDGKIHWVTSILKAGESLYYTYKVKVK